MKPKPRANTQPLRQQLTYHTDKITSTLINQTAQQLSTKHYQQLLDHRRPLDNSYRQLAYITKLLINNISKQPNLKQPMIEDFSHKLLQVFYLLNTTYQQTNPNLHRKLTNLLNQYTREEDLILEYMHKPFQPPN